MTGRRTFRPATASDVERLARTLLTARVFPDSVALDAAREAAPWRFQVTDGGDCAVLEPWRDHLHILAVEALWCPERMVPSAMRQLRALALARGFGDLVSPPVPIEQAHAYEAAGMRIFETASTLVCDVSTDVGVGGPPGIVIRPVTVEDIPSLLAIDIRCFDEFWRYDVRHLEHFLSTQRLAVAAGDAGPIGYTLSTVQLGDGLLGRVAVTPEWHRRGVGTLLVGDALRHLREQGVRRITLCTQTGNEAARALYARTGFRDTGHRFAFLRFG